MIFWTITVLDFALLAGEWGVFVICRSEDRRHGRSALLEELGSLPFSFETAGGTVGINIATAKVLYTAVDVWTPWVRAELPISGASILARTHGTSSVRQGVEQLANGDVDADGDAGRLEGEGQAAQGLQQR